MTTKSVVLATAALLIGSGIATAQQQKYDSLGPPTPAPNQNASPNAAEPNVPKSGAGVSGNAIKSGMTGTSYTTGAGAADKRPAADAAGAATGPDAPNNNGGATPNGLTPD